MVAFGATTTLGMAVGMLPIFAFGALGPFITESIDMSRTGFGGLLTALYVAAALASPAVGRLVDVIGPRRLLFGLVTIAGSGFVLAGVVGGFSGLVAGAALFGLGLALVNPVTNGLIALHTEPSRRGTMVGITYSGTQLAIILAGLLMPPAAGSIGWDRTFVLSGGICLSVLLVAGVVIPRVPVREPQAPQGLSQPHASEGSVGTLTWVALYAFCMAFAVTNVPAYLPLFAVDALGLSPTVAGYAISVIGVVGVPARILWSRAAGTGPGTRHMTLLTIGSLLSLLVVIASGLGGGRQWTLWIGVVAFGATGIAWLPVTMMAVLASAGRDRAGSAAGWVQGGTYIGAAVGPIVFGYLVDRTGQYAAGWSVAGVSFLVAVLLARALRLRLLSDSALRGAGRA